MDQSEVVTQLRWPKTKNNRLDPTEYIKTRSTVVDLCGSENGEFSHGSANWIHQVSLLNLSFGIIDLGISSG